MVYGSLPAIQPVTRYGRTAAPPHGDRAMALGASPV